MADNYVFKVQVSLPGNVETVYIRQYVDPVDRCFDKFKNNLIQRYDVLNKKPFKMMWFDSEGDKISIFNEEDLRTFMEMKASKLFVEVDGASNSNEKKTGTEKIQPVTRVPLVRSCGRSGIDRGWDLAADRRCRFLSGLSLDANGSNPIRDSNAAPGVNLPSLLHVGVQCDGCDAEIRGYRYKCIECPDFDLCFTCETKKLHGDHMMLRIVKPLDRPFNRHFLKTMLKQRCEGKEKDRDSRRRHSHHNRHNGNVFVDIITDIAENMATATSATPSNENTNTCSAQDSGTKSAECDASKQFALNADTFAKAGVVISNLAQHFANVMDPFSVHEFIPTTSKNSTEPQRPETQPGEVKSNESQKSAEKPQDDILESTESVALVAPIAPTVATVPTPVAAPVPISVPTPVPNPSTDVVTIEDVIESPAVERDSSPIPDWALVDVNGHVEGDQPKHNEAIPKAATAPAQTPDSIGSVYAAQAIPMPNYAVLARDLQDHLRNTLKSQSSQTAPHIPAPERVIHHPNPRINEAIVTMTSMGFSNGGGWLTRLLENVDGDIPKALEKLHPSQ